MLGTACTEDNISAEDQRTHSRKHFLGRVIFPRSDWILSGVGMVHSTPGHSLETDFKDFSDPSVQKRWGGERGRRERAECMHETTVA